MRFIFVAVVAKLCVEIPDIPEAIQIFAETPSASIVA